MTVHYRLVRKTGSGGFPQKPFAFGVAEFAPVIGDIIMLEGQQAYRVEERRMFHTDHHIPDGKAWPVFLSIGWVDLYVEHVVL